MTSAAPLRQNRVALTSATDRNAGQCPAEFTVTVQVSTTPGQDTVVVTRFAERLRAALQPPVMPVHEPSPALCVDVPARAVRLHGVELPLTRLEFDLLLYLTRHAGRVLTRHTLLREVWLSADTTQPRTVDVHIRRLRRVLDPESSVISTVRGIGYRLNATQRIEVLE